MPTALQHYHVAAYFPEWEVRRPYYVRHIDAAGLAEKITLINYAFGRPGPDPVTGEVVGQMLDPLAAYGQVYTPEMSVAGAADDPAQPLRGHFNQLRQLKAKYPHLKVVISLGGWTESGWFSDAARTPATRRRFVESCIDLFIHGNLPPLNGAGGLQAGAGVFDGIDIDWEYPLADGLPENHYHPDDNLNFVLLLEEFRRQFQAIGRPELLLTAAVPGPDQAGYFNMTEAHPYLDLVALMTYDLWGSWKPISGHHTSLYNSARDPRPEPERISADATIRLYRDRYGVPAEKILIGAAFYGRGWQDVGRAGDGLYQPGQTYSTVGSNYFDLKARLEQGYQRHWDEQALAPWLYSPSERVFWSYDDPRSVALKAQYVKHHGLGGVMFWEISGDDAEASLLNAIYDGLQPEAPSEDPRPERQAQG